MSGSKLTTRQTERHRESIRIGVILERLNRIGAGELEVSSQALKANEILLSHALPKLQSMEITQDDQPQMDVGAMRQRLLELIQADPEIAKELQTALTGKPDLKVINGDS